MAKDSTKPPKNTQAPLQLIQPRAPELRIAILSHVPDRQTLRSVVLSCSAFSTAYYSYQRQILLELTRKAFEVDRINIAIPLLACRAQRLDVMASNHLDLVTALLETNSERYTLTEQAIRQISIEECKQMLRLKDAASVIFNDLISHIPLHHPLRKENVMALKPLSATERNRISMAIYRWELWAGLFSQRARYRVQDQDPAARIDVSPQKTVYLARYTRWEQEQLCCLYDYVFRRYERLFDESGKWLEGDGLNDSAARDFDNWSMLFANADASLAEANYGRSKLDQILSRGPRVFAALLHENDIKSRCDTIMASWYNLRPFFWEVLCPQPFWIAGIPPAADEDIGATEEDHPYGYRWALATPTRLGDPSLVKAPGYLWPWGYAFWDEDRLRNWGFEIGGPYLYTEVRSVYSDEKDGIRDRVSRRLLRKPQLGV